MAIRFRTACAAAALVPLALLAACGSSGVSQHRPSSSTSAAPSASSNGVTISETGSTLVFPLVRRLADRVQHRRHRRHHHHAGTGSGTGIADAATGTVTIGASDAYLSPADCPVQGPDEHPAGRCRGQVNYNLPGITKPLNLNGKVLATIYAGKINNWNDKAIAALNPG